MNRWECCTAKHPCKHLKSADIADINEYKISIKFATL